MHKYILTERNIDDMAGRIRKFFNSCEECGMNDYSTRRKNIKGKNYWDGSYFSKPSGGNVYIKTFEEEKVIHVELPVTTNIRIGSVIYFLGGNKIMIRRQYNHCYHDENGKTRFGDKDLYSEFVDVYERITKNSYICEK